MSRRLFTSALAVSAWTAARAQPTAPLQPFRHVLSGRTLDGQAYDLRQDQDKVVLVFFWMTSCAVCRSKLPELRANYEAWRNKGFQLVAVSVDSDYQALRTYDSVVNRTIMPAQKFPMLWHGDSSYSDSFGPIAHAPTSFILGHGAREVKQIHGRIDPGLWDDIAELMLN